MSNLFSSNLNTQNNLFSNNSTQLTNNSSITNDKDKQGITN